MANGKWISGLRPEMTVCEAARLALAARFEVVQQYLPLAAAAAAQDVEFVHHVRVGTRRAGAALSQFALCLPEKRLLSAKKLLRRIRRAAGEARDWDVFQETLLTAPVLRDSAAAPALSFLLGHAAARRMEAQ